MEINFETFKARTATRAKKLMLDKDEQARISFIEPSPQLVFIHTFEKVVVGDDGRPIIETDTWPDGSKREKSKTTYEGKLRCLGDSEVVQQSGSDPEKCPACRAHISHPNAVRAPQARILANVLKYSTKPGSFTPTKPFSAELVVWDLTEGRFTKLQTLWQEFGDLKQKDLLLGPCENKQMQKYDIQVANGDAAHTQNVEYVRELLTESYNKDLKEVAAKLPSEFEMSSKVNEITRTYDHVFGTGVATPATELLGSNTSGLTASAASPSSPASPSPVPTPVPAPSPVAADDDDEDDEAEEGTDSEDASANLDDLLKSLGA